MSGGCVVVVRGGVRASVGSVSRSTNRQELWAAVCVAASIRRPLSGKG